MPFPRNRSLSHALACLLLAARAGAGEVNLLEKGECLSPLAEKAPLKMVKLPSGALRFSASDGFFRNVIVTAHLSGLGQPVQLARVGDTVGMRCVVSLNGPALETVTADVLRLGISNSGGTPVTGPSALAAAPGYSDDRSWGAMLVRSGRPCYFWRREPTTPDKAGVLPCGVKAGKLVCDWPNAVSTGKITPDKPFEVIYSLTRTGPKSLKLYAFVADQEHSVELTDVTDFTFDEVHLQYPHSNPLAGATMTVHEWTMVRP